MSSRKDRSRKLVLDAAEAAFGELGFSGASVEDIAERAGLTRKTVYNQFSSKEEIAVEVIARMEALPDPLYRARLAADEPALVVLEKVLTDSAGWCLANPALARIALDPARRPALEPPPGRRSFQLLVCDVLRLGQRQGVVRADEDARFLALVLLGIYAQAMLTALSGGDIGHNAIQRLIAIVLQGIGVPTKL